MDGSDEDLFQLEVDDTFKEKPLHINASKTRVGNDIETEDMGGNNNMMFKRAGTLQSRKKELEGNSVEDHDREEDINETHVQNNQRSVFNHSSSQAKII